MNSTSGLATDETPDDEPLTLSDAALTYLRRGWPIFAVDRGGKKPLVEWKRYQDRLPIEKEVKAWEKKLCSMVGVKPHDIAKLANTSDLSTMKLL